MKTRVLIIEDDQVMRENTAEILDLASYEVKTAVNGKLGSTLAREWLPDLIVCDIMMPELDGYGVLHVLSRDPKTASIPFIFLTAKAEKSEMRKGMELGADDYLTKPFEETELLNAIEARIKKAELLRREFSRDLSGVNSFLETAGDKLNLRDLSKNKTPAKYKKKEILYREGDKPQYLYFINKGSIKASKTHDDGKEFITNMFSAGDFLGHVPLLENRPYTDTASTVEETEVVKIPKEEFLDLLFRNRDIAAQFIKLLSNQVEEQEQKLLQLAYDTVRKRTADALLSILRQNDGKTSVRVTREDLASMAGTASETVIRCLSEFKEDELIEVQGREILILDPEGLENIQ